MKTYPKIPALWKRDKQTHDLLYGTYLNPLVAYLSDKTWVFTEKIDGTNIRIGWDGYSFELGGRTDKAQLPQPILDWFERTFLNDAMQELFEQEFGIKEVILYGEGYGGKIQKQEVPYRDIEDFCLFDVMINGNFLEWTDVLNVAFKLSLNSAPHVCCGTIQAAIDFMKSNPKSMLNMSTPMEGLVGKPPWTICDRFGNRAIVKIKPRDAKCN